MLALRKGHAVTRLGAGRLLVATPLLLDPNFYRTVVLLCAHDEQGSFGLVLNRPLEAAVADVAPEWGSVVADPPLLFAGGPVDGGQGFAIGRGEFASGEPRWTPVGAGVGLVGMAEDPGVLPGLVEVRLFVGYAGWGAGQLEAEVAEEAWFVLDAMDGDAFTLRPERLWHEVLARQRGELRLFSLFPPDPRLN